MLKRELNSSKNSQEPLTPLGRLVLVVDDSDVDRKLIGRLLKKSNFRLEFAEDGVQGLKLARDLKPDLILLDGVMPGLSGAEVCQMLKKDNELKKIPVIFLTGMDTPGYIVDCYNIGAEHYLNKPINSRELISQIETTLKDSARP